MDAPDGQNPATPLTLMLFECLQVGLTPLAAVGVANDACFLPGGNVTKGGLKGCCAAASLGDKCTFSMPERQTCSSLHLVKF